jgi:hypothetical protein
VSRPRKPPLFDPVALLQALEDARLDYVVIGGIARVLHGSGELTDGLDIVPARRDALPQRLDRLAQALDLDPIQLGDEPVEVATQHGRLRLVPVPWGTRGYDELRRSARREHLGGTLRPQIASTVDLDRMLEASPRPQDAVRLTRLRRLMELERQLHRGHGIER